MKKRITDFRFFTVFIYTSDLVPTPVRREKSQHGLRSRKVTTRPGVGKSHNTSSCREKVTSRAGKHGCGGLCGLLLNDFLVMYCGRV